MEENLFNEFSPITTVAWEEIINKDLKGADYDKKLIWKTIEGFNVRPYYRAEDLQHLDYINKNNVAEFPFVRSTKTENNWKIRQDIFVSNVEEVNKLAVSNIKNGVNSIGFLLYNDVSESQFDTLLKDIDLEKIEINFLCHSLTDKYVEFLLKYCKKNNIDTNKVTGSNNFDPLGHLILSGVVPCSESNNSVIEEMKKFKNELPNFKIISINAGYFNNAGGSIVEELAFGLSMASQYLDKLTDTGNSIDEITKRIRFNFSTGSNYFMEIAKLRAARYLWAKIVEAYNPKDKNSTKINIHSETSFWNKTVYDPYVNMLRVTTEAMSAVLGGTDSLTVYSFDSAYNCNPSDFAYRIAKNVQLIIKEEAHFGKVIDPAAGSYYIENLTNSLIEESWKLFLEVEDMGGFFAAFKTEFIQNKIEETSKLRDKNIATRKEILLGTNQYPNFNEVLKNTELCNCDCDVDGEKIAKPIKYYRAAEQFEKLRLSVDKFEKRPVAFMLTIGNLNMRKARSQFACNFFACAGFEVIDNNGFENITEGIKESENKKADIIVLCSSDEEYENYAIELKQTTNKIIVIAGNPECKATLEKNGITNFISIKSNVLEELKGYVKILNKKI